MEFVCYSDVFFSPLPPSPAAAHGVRQPLFPVADYQENTSAASKSSATTAAASSMLTAPNQILIYDDLETSMVSCLFNCTGVTHISVFMRAFVFILAGRETCCASKVS